METEHSLWVFILLGFVAQMVDGSLGMAYGVTSNSLLMAFGIPPAAASSSVHMAEIITTAISGFSHFKLGNINKQFVLRLVFTGIIGGVLGAYVLSNIDGSKLKPWIALYLLLMGVRILIKAIRFNKHKDDTPPVPGKVQMGVLGLFGGFFDAIGGGGWGPIVTTTLISNGHSPRETIGSVNFSEFFVTLAESITFLILLAAISWHSVLGLIIGGAIAAPIGALFTKKIPVRLMLFLVSALIIGLQIRQLLLSWVL